jgi:hypothetical protein
LQAYALAMTAGAVLLGVAFAEIVFSLSGRVGSVWPALMGLSPFVAAVLALVSMLLPGQKLPSWIVLLFALAGCVAVIWLMRMKPDAWK